MGHGSIEVATAAERAFVRVRGTADFECSEPFRRFVRTMLDRQISDFVLDLGECTTMDSTFMGALTAVARDVGRRHPGKRVVLARLGDENHRLLATLGILLFFELTSEVVVPSALEPSPPAPLSTGELTREVLDAHQALRSVSERNALEFRDVCEVLERELVAKTEESSHRPR